MDSADLYRRTENDVRVPPSTFREIVKYLGPGLIVTGSIVGSGELIASTRLGAEIGFALLWFMVISCVIKVVVQIEIGRYAISSGQTALQAFNQVPGPRLLGTGWLVWWWFLMFCSTAVQSAGIVSAVGQTLHLSFGSFPASLGLWDSADPAAAERGSVGAWTVITAISGIILLFRGRYGLVQTITTTLVFLFTLTTIADVALVQRTEFAIRAEEVWQGLKGSIPQNGLLIAFGVFGITGVGASELVYYPYWCLEKGYARFAGPRTDTPEWARRAAGWVRVLRVDAWSAMFIYTLATIAFYLLGAAVLHRQGTLPEGFQLVRILSDMYHKTLPAAGYVIFLIGAFVVLYSTFFVATASLSRVLADFVRIVRRFEYRDARHRANWISLFVVLLPIIYCTCALLIPDQPVMLVMVGAVGQALTLPPIAAAAVYFRYKRTDRRLAPGRLSDACLWVTTIGMWLVSAYKLWDTITPAAS